MVLLPSHIRVTSCLLTGDHAVESLLGLFSACSGEFSRINYLTNDQELTI